MILANKILKSELVLDWYSNALFLVIGCTLLTPQPAKPVNFLRLTQSTISPSENSERHKATEIPASSCFVALVLSWAWFPLNRKVSQSVVECRWIWFSNTLRRMETAVLKCCETLQHSAIGVAEKENSLSLSHFATLCDTQRWMETLVQNSATNCDPRTIEWCDVILKMGTWCYCHLKPWRQTLHHTATNRTTLLQSFIECSKPKVCNTLRHFATFNDSRNPGFPGFTFFTDPFWKV